MHRGRAEEHEQGGDVKSVFFVGGGVESREREREKEKGICNKQNEKNPKKNVQNFHFFRFC